MHLRVIIATIVSLLVTLPSAASESVFDRWLSWDGLSASFTQFEYDVNGALIRTSEGDLILQRPNYALWKIQTPDPQTFYANAKGVWHYDPWLEVATFHSNESSGDQATLALFSGNKSALEQRYAVTETDDQLSLTPRDSDSQIQAIRMTLTREGYPRSIEIQTSLGHRSLIEIVNAQTGHFPEDVFTFKPPPGTEIQ